MLNKLIAFPESHLSFTRALSSGLLRQFWFHSRLAEKPVDGGTSTSDYSYYAITPQTPASHRMPIVYFLHGQGGDWHGYTEDTLQVFGRLAEQYSLAFVLADGNPNGWWTDGYFNRENGEKNFIHSYFIRELMPSVEHTLAVDPAKRLLMGMSMGGMGTLNIGMWHPDLFKALAPLSPVLNLFPWEGGHTNNHWRHLQLFGDPNTFRDHWLANSPLHRVHANPEFFHAMPLYLACGYQDFLWEENLILHQLLEGQRVPHIFDTRDGYHDMEFWKKIIPDMVKWFVADVLGEGPAPPAHP